MAGWAKDSSVYRHDKHRGHTVNAISIYWSAAIALLGMVLIPAASFGQLYWIDSSRGFGWFYKLSAVDPSGSESDPVSPQEITGTPDVNAPMEWHLWPCTPNPFNPATTIQYDVLQGGRATLRIYDVRGALVCTLVDSELPQGRHQAVWDGRGEHGQAAAGVYFYRLEAVGFSETRRMCLVK